MAKKCLNVSSPSEAATPLEKPVLRFQPPPPWTNLYYASNPHPLRQTCITLLAPHPIGQTCITLLAHTPLDKHVLRFQPTPHWTNLYYASNSNPLRQTCIHFQPHPPFWTNLHYASKPHPLGQTCITLLAPHPL